MSTLAPTDSRHNLHLVRHGQTEWNLQGRWQGHRGGPLTAEGIRQAEAVASKFSDQPIEVIYCSDLERAAMTAQHISAVCKVSVITDARLREICLGEWEGQLGEELRRAFPRKFEERTQSPLTFRPPQGESLLDVKTRLQSWIADVQSSSFSQIVVVSHAVTLAVLRAEILGEPLDSAYHSHLANCETFCCSIPAVSRTSISEALI